MTAILEVTDLKLFQSKGLFSRTVGHVRAVDGVSFSVNQGEALGLVGESGCGKTTTGRCILRLIEPTSGSVKFDGREIIGLPFREMRQLRRQMQIIFQDPYSSLNPRLSVRTMLTEVLTVHNIAKGRIARERVAELLRMVGLSPSQAARYPHEFSGGQRRRIGIARALALNPRLIGRRTGVGARRLDSGTDRQSVARSAERDVADLPVHRARSFGRRAHQQSCRRDVSRQDRRACTEPRSVSGSASPVYGLAAVGDSIARSRQEENMRIVLKGDVPNPAKPPSGCRFHPRCFMAQPICSTDEPPLREVLPGHWSACHFADDVPAATRPPHVVHGR